MKKKQRIRETRLLDSSGNLNANLSRIYKQAENTYLKILNTGILIDANTFRKKLKIDLGLLKDDSNLSFHEYIEKTIKDCNKQKEVDKLSDFTVLELPIVKIRP